MRRCPSNSRHRPASWRAAVPEADATPFALRALQSRACSKPCRRTPTTTQRTRARPRRVPRVPARTRRRRRLSRRPLRPHAAVPVARRRAACRAPGRHRLLPAHPADPGGGRLPVGVVPGALSGVPRMNPPPRHLAARRPLAHRRPTARRCASASGSRSTRRRGRRSSASASTSRPPASAPASSTWPRRASAILRGGRRAGYFAVLLAPPRPPPAAPRRPRDVYVARARLRVCAGSRALCAAPRCTSGKNFVRMCMYRGNISR